jgi:SNF-related kinase
VQEEEDDIGDEGEPSSPLNRRGSRSEGRINLTVQDRLAAEVAERLKKQEQQHQQSCARVAANIESDLTSSKVVSKGLIEGIANVKLIRNDNNKEKFLGQAGGGNRKEIRSGSVDHKMQNRRLLSGQGDLKILTDSSTVPAINISNVLANQIPSKPFKTLPSPTRACAAPSTASNCLKEIFEEGDAGSSDNSNTNTPRPIIRSTNSGATPSTSHQSTHHHRRTKFHKSRTTSCSSSDASDDDSEKKRGAAAATTNKIVDSAIKKQFNFQRRDSDSSDSQDPGTGCSGGNNAGSSLILRNGASTTTTGGNSKSSNTSNQQSGGASGGEFTFIYG